MNPVKLKEIFNRGGLFAYPTEGVFGLGCDPLNEKAVMRLLKLKQRPIEKGLILLAANWKQLAAYMGKLSDKQCQTLKQSWPGPITWLVPASDKVPAWIRGKHQTVAMRITKHPVAKQLCEKLDSAIVSTSANLADTQPCKDEQSVISNFATQVDIIIPGQTDGLTKPTPIFNLNTEHQLR